MFTVQAYTTLFRREHVNTFAAQEEEAGTVTFMKTIRMSNLEDISQGFLTPTGSEPVF